MEIAFRVFVQADSGFQLNAVLPHLEFCHRRTWFFTQPSLAHRRTLATQGGIGYTLSGSEATGSLWDCAASKFRDTPVFDQGVMRVWVR